MTNDSENGDLPVGEIKSTLELAMERTKKMTISEEEREEIKRKEIEQKVNSLSNRYIEGHLSLNEILKEMGRMDKNAQTTVREILLSQWIEALSLSDEDERFLKGIESLKQRSVDELKQKHQQLTSQYETEKEQLKENIRAQLAGTLKKDGIEGSAVEPNIEWSPLWKKAKKNLDELTGGKLKEIKEELKNL
jgi:hypothetical protein